MLKDHGMYEHDETETEWAPDDEEIDPAVLGYRADLFAELY